MSADVSSRAGSSLRRLGSAYEEARGRMTGLVAALGEREASTPVPACPAWSVRDVLAHLTGICADISSGNIKGAATDAWTAAQVEARKDRSVVEILEEWRESAPPIAGLVDDFPGRYGAQIVADATVHEHDIRGALASPGARDGECVSIALDFLLTTRVHSGATALGLGPLEVNAGERRWIVGTGERGGRDPAALIQAAMRQPEHEIPDVAAVASVRAGMFELMRAVTGRRSAAQIRSYEWTADPEPYLPLFGVDPFTVRPDDLIE